MPTALRPGPRQAMARHPVKPTAAAEAAPLTPPGWYVGTAIYRSHEATWAVYAFDTTIGARLQNRAHELTATGDTRDDAMREMARLLEQVGTTHRRR